MIHIYNSCRNVNVKPNLNLYNSHRAICLEIAAKCSVKDNGKDVFDKGKVSTKKSNNNGEKEYPEEPSSCCMSGCANCVWLDYAEKLSEYYRDGGEKAIKEINEKVTDPNIKAFLLQELKMRNTKK